MCVLVALSFETISNGLDGLVSDQMPYQVCVKTQICLDTFMTIISIMTDMPMPMPQNQPHGKLGWVNAVNYADIIMAPAPQNTALLRMLGLIVIAPLTMCEGRKLNGMIEFLQSMKIPGIMSKLS